MPDTPGQYNKTLRKGTPFTLAFRLLENGVSIAFDANTQSVVFRASESASEDDFFLYNSDDDPSVVSWDADAEVFAIEVPHTATLTIPYKQMVYDIDLVTDGIPERWLVGVITIKEQA